MNKYNKNINKVITHDDYDGVISFLLYKKFINPNCTLEGFYKGCQKLVTKNPYIPNKMEYIGIDIEFEEFYNIGHHLQYQSLTHPELSGNPNIKAGLDGAKNIYEKCPFSTALLLVLKSKSAEKWFVDAINNKDYASLALVLYADNFYPYIWDRYNINVLRWFKAFKNEKLYKTIYNFQKYPENRAKLIQEMEKIENELVKYLLNGTQGKYRQKIKFDHLLTVFEILGAKLLLNFKIEGGFDNVQTFKYNEREISDELILWLEEEFKKGNLLSHGVTNKTTINYTLR